MKNHCAVVTHLSTQHAVYYGVWQSLCTIIRASAGHILCPFQQTTSHTL